MTDLGNLKSIRLEYDTLKALEEGTALPLSAFAAEKLIKDAFESDIPIFVIDNDGQILWKLELDSKEVVCAILTNK